MIQANVRKRLGDFFLDAELEGQGFMGLGGPNGSGKSTLLNIIAGGIQPDQGDVRIDGADVTCLPMEKRGVVMVTPDSCIPHLDVDAHLIWGTRVKGTGVDRKYLHEVKEVLGISFGGRVGELSLGMRERVSLATALISRPSAVLVDEAFSNLSGRDDFINAYRSLSKEAGVDVVFTTQTIEAHVDRLDHLYGIEGGRVTRVF